MSKAREIAFLGLFLSLAIIASYIERVLPSPVPMIPGIKLGLANAIVLIIMHTKGNKTAFSLNILRILASGIMFSGPWGMIYSFSGGIASFIVMVILKKMKIFSIIGVSVGGAVFHNIGQIFVAVIVIDNIKLLYYLPVLVIFGIITGLINGFISGNCLIRLKSVK